MLLKLGMDQSWTEVTELIQQEAKYLQLVLVIQVISFWWKYTSFNSANRILGWTAWTEVADLATARTTGDQAGQQLLHFLLLDLILAATEEWTAASTFHKN